MPLEDRHWHSMSLDCLGESSVHKDTYTRRRRPSLNFEPPDRDNMLQDEKTPHEMLQLLLAWCLKSKQGYLENIRLYNRYTIFHERLNNSMIILSTVSTLGGFATSPACPEWYHWMLYILFNCITGIVTLLATFQRVYRFSERAEKHRMSAKTFQKFYRKIQVLLLTPRSKRGNIYEVVDRCNLEFEYILNIAPESNGPDMIRNIVSKDNSFTFVWNDAKRDDDNITYRKSSEVDRQQTKDDKIKNKISSIVSIDAQV